ncbi:hypothetical protein DN392_17960 [Bacillus sp. BB51/4]|nr:hypothetical protein DN392_17960 [Bacillus sp. BB51/4]KXY10730.1 hypothetical protein AT260_24835 [Bacillus wiedmannii]OAK22001.1 hypothetical protein A6282_06835 [Bacillus wiedmannii]OAK25706.1 hypothetical protein A6281_19140 [Bacillus wiedmannii]OAK39343.1 hypothetical protein A6286_08565 [Bacillus wiedmannii]
MITSVLFYGLRVLNVVNIKRVVIVSPYRSSVNGKWNSYRTSLLQPNFVVGVLMSANSGLNNQRGDNND